MENIDNLNLHLPQDPNSGSAPSSVPGYFPLVPKTKNDGVKSSTYFPLIRKQESGEVFYPSTDYEIDDIKSYRKFLSNKSQEFFVNDYEVMNETRAQAQSGGAKLAALVPNFLSQTLTEIGKMPGYLGGAIGYAATGDIDKMVDNAWIQAMDSADEKIKSLLPVYTSRAILEGGLLKQLSHADFWATDFADGLGFLAAYMVPGAALKALGLGAKIARGIGGTAKLANGIDMGLATVTNSVMEAAAEAGGVVQDMKAYYKDALSQGLLNPETGVPYTQNDIDKAIGTAGRNTFLTNMAILMGPNYIMNKNILGAFGLGEKGVGEVLEKAVAKEGANAAAKSGRAEVFKRLAESIASEGFWEEGSQTATTNLFENIAKGTREKGDVLSGLMDEYADMLTTTDGQKSVFLGALMGGMGGVVGGIREQKAKKRAVSNLSDLLNKNFESTVASFTSAYQRDENNKLVMKDGMPVADMSKLVSALKNGFGEEATSYLLDAYAKAGQTENYLALTNDVLTRFMLPYLQHEGGLDAMFQKMEELNPEIQEQLAQIGGKDVATFRQEFRDRATELQRIYNHISLNNNDFFKLEANTKEEKIRRNDFIQRLQFNSIMEASRQLYLDNEIAKKEQKIADIKATNTEFTDTSKLEEEVKELKDTRDEARKAQKLLLNKKEQQKAFREEVAEAAKLEQEMKDNAPAPTESSEEIENLLKNHTRRVPTDNQEYVTESDEFELNLQDEKGEDIVPEVAVDPSDETKGKQPLSNKYRIAGKSVKGLKLQNVETGHFATLRGDGSVELDLDGEIIIAKSKTLTVINKAPEVKTEQGGAHTPFTGAESFEMSTGNQEQALRIINDDAATPEQKRDAADALRWYGFLENYKIPEGKTPPAQVLMTMSYEQVSKMDKDDPIRQGLRFYVPTIKQSLTVDQIDKLDPKDKKGVENDIKLLVMDVTREDGKESFSPYSEDSKLVWSSLPTASFTMAGGYERFSYDGINPDLLEEKKKAAAEEHERRRQAYRTQSQKFTIAVKYPGSRVALPEGQESTTVVGSIITEEQIPNLEIRYTKEGDSKSPKIISYRGKTFTLFPGRIYAWNESASTFEDLQYRKLSDQEIDNYVSLLKELTSNDAITRQKILKYLNTVARINKNDGPYKFRVRTSQQNEFNRLEFGDQVLTVEDLNGSEKLDAFREHLKDKFHAVDYRELDGTGEFTEYNVVDGKLQETVWSAEEGGYKAFLFSTRNGRQSKLMSPVRLRSGENSENNDKAPQYVNAKAGLKPYGKRISLPKAEPKAESAVEPVAEPVQTEEKKFGFFEVNKPYRISLTRPDGQPGSWDGVEITWNGKSFDYKGDPKAIEAARQNLNSFFGNKELGNPTIEMFKEAYASKNAKLDFVPVRVDISQESQLTQSDMDEVIAEVSKETGIKISPEAIAHAIKTVKYNPRASKEFFRQVLLSVVNPGTIIPSGRVRTIHRRLNTGDLVDMTEGLRYLQELFPEFDITMDKLEGNTGGMVIDSMKLILSPFATVGTQYHEAYHIVSLAFMTAEQRNNLYDEVRERTGKLSMSNRDAEEYLAEEFRIYKLSPENYKFGKNQPLKQNWFEKLVAFLSRLLNKLHPGSLIEDTFTTLDLKPYRSEDRKSTVLGTYKRVGSLSETATNQLLENLDYEFFNLLFSSTDVNYSQIASGEVSLNAVYDNIRDFIINDIPFVAQENVPGEMELINETLSNWDGLVALHKKYLAQNGVKLGKAAEEISEDTDEEEGVIREDKGNNVRDFFESNLVDVKDGMPGKVKLMLMGLPVAARSEAGVQVSYDPVTHQGEGFVFRRNYQYNKLVNFLHSNLAGISSYRKMIDKLKELEDENPEMGPLLVALKEQFDKSEPSLEDIKMRVAFFTQFSKTKNTPIITFLRSNGDISFVDAVVSAVQDRIGTEWRNNIRQGAGGLKSVYFESEGEFVVDLEKKIKIGQDKLSLSELKSNRKLWAKYAGVEDPEIKNAEKVKLYKGILDFLNAFGMEITDKPKNVLGHPELFKLMNLIINRVKPKMTMDDFYSKNVMAINAEINQALELAVNLSTDVQDLQFLNADNKREYSIALGSYLSQVFNGLKNDGIPSHLKPADKGGNNLSTVGSILLERAAKGRVPRVVMLRSTKTEANENEDMAALSPTDLAVTSFNAVLKGHMQTMRAGDRTLEYAIDPQYTKEEMDRMYAMGHKEMFAYMSNALISEVATVFALHMGMGSNLKNFTKNGSNLRIFKNELIGPNDIKEYYDSHKTVDNQEFGQSRSAQALALANAFVRSNKQKVGELFDSMLKERTQQTIDTLLKTGVVRKTEAGKYRVIGINQEVIQKVLGNRISELDHDQLYKLAELETFLFFQGAVEQSKLVTGDIANYGAPRDVPKRNKAATSTRKVQSHDAEMQQKYDQEYPKWNSRYTDNTRMVVYNDVMDSTDNYDEVLGEDNDYKSINVTDGQVKSTLDSARQMLLQEDNWSEAQERTYQWEMQMVTKRFGELGWLTKEQVADKFKTVFAQHTGGIVPVKPMYKGTVIQEKDKGIIPPSKPKGYGPIANEGMDFMNNILDIKASIASMFPSTLPDNSPMLRQLFSMMQNNIDLMVFGSAAKMESFAPVDLYDQNGNMNEVTPDTEAMEMSYDYIGNQLDIEPEVHKEVTKSTQKTRLESLNQFEHGKAVLNGSTESAVAGLKEEQISLISELSTRELNNLTAELGLKEEDGNYYLDTTDKEAIQKFRKALIGEFERRQMPVNAVDGLEAVLDNDAILFDTLFIKLKIQQVLNALVRNRAISLKTNGDLKIQESSVGYDTELKFYQYKEGMRRISKAEVMIDLPADWMPFVESVGGLDEFNRRIAARDYKSIGLDENLFVFSANRIPSGGLNALEAFRVKKFLPPSMGSRIILPKEIVVKSGTDFDVDKMTCYLPNYKLVNGKPTYVRAKEGKPVEQQSTQALQNRLNELSMEILLNPANFKLLITPNSSATLEGFAKKYTDYANQTAYTAPDLFHWATNMKISQVFWAGRQMISVAAINNVRHAVSQRAPVRISDPTVEIWFEGQERATAENPVRMGYINDASGREISENFAEFLTSYVDVTKKPHIFYLNADKIGFPVYAFLNCFSANSPTGIEMIASFMTQPIITRFIEEYGKARSMLVQSMRNNENAPDMEVNVEDIYNKLMSEFVTDGKYAGKYRESLASLYAKYFAEPDGSIRKQALQKQIETRKGELGYQNLSMKDLQDNREGKDGRHANARILDMFLVYREYARKLDDFHQVSRPDSSYPKSMNATRYRMFKLEQVKSDGFFNSEDVESFLTNTELKSFYEAWKKNQSLFGSFFLTGSGPLSELLQKVIRTYEGQYGMDVEYVLDRFEPDIVNYILHTRSELSSSPMFDGPLNTQYERLMLGKDAVADRMVEMRKRLPDNYLLQELYPVFRPMIGRRRQRAETKNIKLFMRRYTAPESDRLVNSFTEMLTSTDPEIRSFATDLAALALVQNGFTKTPISFTELIPNSIIQPVFRSIIENYEDELGSMSPIDIKKEMTHVFNSFLKMNYTDKRIMPRMSYSNMSTRIPEAYNEITGRAIRAPHFDYGRVPTTSDISAFEYLAYEVDAVDQQTKNALRNEGKPVPRKVLLYRRSEEVEYEGFNSFYTYKMVPMGLGEGIYLKEIYADDQKSVLKSNDSGLVKQTVNKPDIDVEEEFKYAPKPLQRTATQPNPVQKPVTKLTVREEIVAKLASVIKDTARKWLPKEQAKAKIATQYIGDGAPDSSTDRYKKLYNSYGLANTGKYTQGDIVWVSSNGKRNNRVNPVENGVLQGVYKNIDKAIRAGAAIVMDTYEHIEATKNYNIGEVELAKYMHSKEYVRDNQGVWRPSAKLMEKLSDRALSAIEEGDTDVQEDMNEAWDEFEKSRSANERSLSAAENGEEGMDAAEWQFYAKYSDPNQYSIERDERNPDPELDNAVKSFLASIGVKVESVKEIVDEFGNSEGYVAVADLINRTIQFVEGKIGITELPEEAAHWYVELLGKDNPVYQKMMNDIVNYQVYEDVLNSEYYDIYQGDENRIRKEAVGKLIAKYMVKEYTDNKVESWWRAIWNNLLRLFRKARNDNYATAARNIIENKLSELRLTAEEVSTSGIKTIKSGTTEIYNQHPELKAVGSLEQYSMYLNSIFPESQMKNIVYHGTSEFEGDAFKKEKLASLTGDGTASAGFHFSNKQTATAFGIPSRLKTGKEIFTVPVLLNMTSKVDMSDMSELRGRFGKGDIAAKVRQYIKDGKDSIYIKSYQGGPDYIVFEPEQIHILGSKKDVEGFQDYINTFKQYSAYTNQRRAEAYQASLEERIRERKLREAQQKKQNKQTAVTEVRKVAEKPVDSVDRATREILDNFEKYFPAYADFTNEERAEFVRMMSEGQIEIYC